MKNTLKNNIIEMDGDALRQYIDAKSVFTALESAHKTAKEVRGGMIWREQNGTDYLIRTSTRSAQKSLGPRSEKTEEIYTDFIARKERSQERVRDLRAEIIRHQRMNKALRVGRAPDLLVEILNKIEEAGLSGYFTVIGTYALYAYEAAAGIRITSTDAMTTMDVDLLWDIRKRLGFTAQMDELDTTFLGLLKKVDRTFERRDSQLYTAVNSKGFEVDIVRRSARSEDPHQVRLTDNENELFAIEAEKSGPLLDRPKMSEMIVSVTGRMARMNTVAPDVFVKTKRWIATLDNRDALKRRRDLLQADLVDEIIREYLPHQSVAMT